MSAPHKYTLVGVAGTVRLRDEPVAPPAATEVLVRVSHTLVSAGTERHYLRQQGAAAAPLALGYCAVGSVAGLGEQVCGLAPGDAVIAMGWELATHSNYVMMPRKLVCKLPDGMAPTDAIVATIGATAIHAADRAALVPGERVLVVGLGLVGMLTALAARDAGCEVWGYDRDEALTRAQLCWRGHDLARGAAPGAGFSKLFLCVDAGLDELFPQALAALDPDGNGHTRSRLINVGRLSGQLTLAPAMGNFDIVNAARCGAGYRDDDYHHGRKSVAVLPGEATVERNLQRCLALLGASLPVLARMPRTLYSVPEALAAYNADVSFAPGINLIAHDSAAPAP